MKSKEVSPHDEGCWYCYTQDDNLVFSSEFDTFVHIHCIEQALKRDPKDLEALIFKREFGVM